MKYITKFYETLVSWGEAIYEYRKNRYPKYY
jgi:hypothetical protein